jgi:hypothetical protein
VSGDAGEAVLVISIGFPVSSVLPIPPKRLKPERRRA